MKYKNKIDHKIQFIPKFHAELRNTEREQKSEGQVSTTFWCQP